jgi:hypothetical protein
MAWITTKQVFLAVCIITSCFAQKTRKDEFVAFITRRWYLQASHSYEVRDLDFYGILFHTSKEEHWRAEMVIQERGCQMALLKAETQEEQEVHSLLTLPQPFIFRKLQKPSIVQPIYGTVTAGSNTGSETNYDGKKDEDQVEDEDEDEGEPETSLRADSGVKEDEW